MLRIVEVRAIYEPILNDDGEHDLHEAVQQDGKGLELRSQTGASRVSRGALRARSAQQSPARRLPSCTALGSNSPCASDGGDTEGGRPHGERSVLRVSLRAAGYILF